MLYGRLSNEDSREGTSLSIQHQEEMLRDYAAKQGFCNPLFLYDDGVSGIKSNYPGFQKVLAMIRDGQAAYADCDRPDPPVPQPVGGQQPAGNRVLLLGPSVYRHYQQL
ncbi:recombinase family protein [Solibaculum intestinale]|uniref:recombinase family protein n=1 Tax=Solibaculum intestinale TaxID=3133165 RepID=UPI00338FD6E0